MSNSRARTNTEFIKRVINKAIKLPYTKSTDKRFDKVVILKAGIISSVCSVGKM